MYYNDELSRYLSNRVIRYHSGDLGHDLDFLCESIKKSIVFYIFDFFVQHFNLFNQNYDHISIGQ